MALEDDAQGTATAFEGTSTGDEPQTERKLDQAVSRPRRSRKAFATQQET